MAETERTVRTVATDQEVATYLQGLLTAFLAKREVTAESVAYSRDRWDLSRTWMAVDGDTQCGSARTFPSRLRLPGLGDVAVSCLTQVTVLPTNTRRGHLSRLMGAHLEAAVEAGEVASLLIAAEWPIYGRFGYGPATEWSEWQVDVARASVLGQPVGTFELVDPAGFDEPAAMVLADQQAGLPGCIERPDWLRQRVSGLDAAPHDEPEKARVWVVHRDPSGRPDGVVMYDPKERWEGMRPASTIEVKDMAFANPQAERELWRYLVDVDLVAHISWEGASTSAIRHVLADGRAAREVGRWDQLWARILDIPACLTARSYAASERLVLEVVDPFLGRGGRFALDATPDGSTCAPTRDEPAVTLPVSTLSASWLGGTDLRSLAAGGAVDEHLAGATDRLAALLRWHQTPRSHTNF